MKFITKLLEFRGAARRFFQKFQLIIEPAFRFFVAYLVFHTINETLNYNTKLASPVLELGLAAVCTFLPQAVMILFGALLAVVQVYHVSPILAALVLLIFAVLYCFIVRFSGKYGYAIVGVPILYIFKIPYLIPLLLGMVATPIAIFPTACGVIVYYVFKVIQEAALRQDVTSLDATLALYIDVANSLFTHKAMFVTIAVFSVVILIMYLVRKLRFEFVFEITIVLGAILNILGFLVINLYVDFGLDTGEVVLGTLVSMLLVFVAQFFRVVLDYMAVEHVQFEDDDYYYYVKAVPKVDLTLPEKSVTTFSEGEEAAETTATEEEFEFDKKEEVPEEEPEPGTETQKTEETQ
ncbi:MAG: hypothetical protein E7260_04610 [Lachnospiraceae bacterium]|nr:hypothetical protein [Lachnospiraceae bacterium]